jgi:hypothetical protein
MLFMPALYTLLSFTPAGLAAQTKVAPKVVPQAEVTFIVTNYFGAPLPYRCKSFIERKRNDDLTGNFESLAGKRIPYGTYHYVLTRTDVVSHFSELEGDLNVYAPSVLNSLSYHGLIIFSGNHEGVLEYTRQRYALEGRIEKASEDSRSLWVRLQGLYLDRKLEAKVEADGRFRFEDYIVGASVLFVFDETHLIAIKPLMFRDPPGKERIEVDLAKDMPQRPN